MKVVNVGGWRAERPERVGASHHQHAEDEPPGHAPFAPALRHAHTHQQRLSAHPDPALTLGFS